MHHPRHLNLGRDERSNARLKGRPAVRRKDTRMDTLLEAPMGLLSGLEAQGEISELLDELFGDGLA
jgi:hypothetical protein